jgi:hypothetical protein
VDRHVRDAVPISDDAQGAASATLLPDGLHLLDGEFSGSAPRVPALLNGVYSVISIRSEKQMAGIATGRVIAPVAHNKTIRYRPVKHRPDHSMRAVRVRPDLEPPIPGVSNRPAIIQRPAGYPVQ